MSDNGFPSMTALLGLLAVAGFQNRDKIAEMLGGAGTPGPGSVGHAAPASTTASNPLGGLLGGLLGGAPAGGAGGFLSGGLGQLVDQFKQNGHGNLAQSWVNPGPNQQIAPPQLEQAIGPDVLTTLIQKTGLSKDELLSRLATTLPHAVDQYTPDGRLPT